MKKILIISIFILLHLSGINQINWQESNLPDSISVFGIDFNSQGTYFITTNKGVLSSEDGFSWVNSNLSIPLNKIFINENNTIYTESLLSYYWSYDSGISWLVGSLDGLGSPHCLYNLGDSITFIGTWSGGLYRTNNSGITWQNVIPSTNSEVFKVVAMDSQLNMYAGSTNYGPNENNKGGLYKSVDFGLTWEQYALDYHYVSDVAIDSEDKMFVTTSGQNFTGAYGIYRSEDYGWTWDMIYDERQSGTIDVNEYDELIVSTIPPFEPAAALLSTDNGNNWEDLISNLDCFNILDIKFTPNNKLAAICRNSNKLFFTEEMVFCDNTIKSDLLVYPNPSSGLIKIKGISDDLKSIKISNLLTGCEEGKHMTQNNPENDCLILDLTYLKAGIYLVEIETDNYEVNYLKVIIK